MGKEPKQVKKLITDHTKAKQKPTLAAKFQRVQPTRKPKKPPTAVIALIERALKGRKS